LLEPVREDGAWDAAAGCPFVGRACSASLWQQCSGAWQHRTGELILTFKGDGWWGLEESGEGGMQECRKAASVCWCTARRFVAAVFRRLAEKTCAP
jgi:hypothetical protein